MSKGRLMVLFGALLTLAALLTRLRRPRFVTVPNITFEEDTRHE